MATLSNKHKTFIVIRLACYDSPTEVVEAFKEEFGVETDRVQVSYYNPLSAFGKEKLAQKWKDLFNETRERFKEEIQGIPIANQAYRLKKLQKNMEQLERMKNYKGANDTIEQAAKEVGGAYTNKLEHTGKDGGPIQVSEVEIVKNKNG
jgi:hypothetical protein